MRCPLCASAYMLKSIEDFDYTQLAGLRGKTVTLVNIPIYRCHGCGPTADCFEVARIGPLTRELEAAGALHVKRLWCQLIDNEWVLSMASGPVPSKRPTKRSKK